MADTTWLDSDRGMGRGRIGIWAGARLCGPRTVENRDFGAFNVYAIIADGPHQYCVEEGQVFEVQRKDLDANAQTIEFDRILMVGGADGVAKVGTPTVEGATVTASIVAEVKGPKLVILKYKKRKNSRTKKGHRQKFLQVKIDKITH